MALRDLLTYTKAWVSGQGTATLPASVITEADARANLQVQHSEARDKINEIVGAITTTLEDADDAHLPTTKAVKDSIVQADWTEADDTDPAYIKNKPSIPSAQVQSDWSEADDSDPAYIKNKPSIPTVSGTTGKVAVFTGANAVGDGFTITISPNEPTGGNDGDIWIKYEA